jgi:hypothetical protein
VQSSAVPPTSSCFPLARFISQALPKRLRILAGLMMQFIFMRHNLPPNDVKNAIAEMNRAEIVTV